MNANHKTERLYNRRASFYDRFFVGRLGWDKELESFFRESNYLQDNHKVLDAGCGTGVITRVLYGLAREKGIREINFHAFDITRNMLDIFQEWATEQAVVNIQVQQASVLELTSIPPHWKEYDLIVSSTMLEYIPKHKIKDALTNLRQLLGTQGTFLGIITKRNFLTQWLAAKWWKANLYNEQEIRDLLQVAGFSRIEFKNFSSQWSKFIMIVEANK